LQITLCQNDSLNKYESHLLTLKMTF